jgi:hypothetical protein
LAAGDDPAAAHPRRPAAGLEADRLMRSGFYSVQNAGSDQDLSDGEGYSLAILAHLKDGRFVGVDPGGCKVVGTYETQTDGRTAVHLAYTFKAGIELPNGMVFNRQTTIESDLLLEAGTLAGEPQPVDIGIGPTFMRLEWLAEPA